MKIIFAVTAAIFASMASTLAIAEEASSAPAEAVISKATSVCQNCHGPQGDSVSAIFPRLNGQQADYIAAQLKSFRSQSRSDPHFAAQKPTPPQSGGALAADGKNIYKNGADAQNIPACQACHGEHAEGNSVIPRLAGQHAYYLKSQLEAFRSTLRDNDVMHANTKDMTNSQIEALVSYLAND